LASISLRVAETLGFKVVMKEGYEAAEVDFRPLLTKVKMATPT